MAASAKTSVGHQRAVRVRRQVVRSVAQEQGRLQADRAQLDAAVLDRAERGQQELRQAQQQARGRPAALRAVRAAQRRSIPA
jgi:hypothetical protein